MHLLYYYSMMCTSDKQMLIEIRKNTSTVPSEQ